MKMRLVAGASIVCPLNCGRSAGPEDPRECQQARCIFAQHGPNKSPARVSGAKFAGPAEGISGKPTNSTRQTHHRLHA